MTTKEEIIAHIRATLPLLHKGDDKSSEKFMKENQDKAPFIIIKDKIYG